MEYGYEEGIELKKLSENYLLGMDIGTTNIKAMIADENGRVAASASESGRLIFPGPNMAEQDAQAWWKNVQIILRRLTDEAGKEIVSRIRGITVSSQTVTMLPVENLSILEKE